MVKQKTIVIKRAHIEGIIEKPHAGAEIDKRVVSVLISPDPVGAVSHIERLLNIIITRIHARILTHGRLRKCAGGQEKKRRGKHREANFRIDSHGDSVRQPPALSQSDPHRRTPRPEFETIAISPLLEKRRIEIRPMNLHVAGGARLKESGLVVKRRGSRRSAEARGRMALQTQDVDVANLQQMRVRRAMHSVARRASLDFHGSVLENKWPLLIGMASEANNVLRRRSAHLLRPSGPMRVVAVGALNQTLVHAVMKRHFELRLLLQVAGIAKLRLALTS